MTKILLCLLFMLSLVSGSIAKTTKEKFAFKEKDRTYYLYVPESVKASTATPMIVLLHGSNRNGQSLVEKWTELAKRESIILVGPDSANSSHWSLTNDGPDFIYSLVETIKSKHSINSKKVYLFGHSAGGVHALSLSMLESEYFAATAIHAGAWRNKEALELIQYAKRKIPIYMYIGTEDDFFPLVDVRATRDALTKQGFSIELIEDKGHNHWYYDKAPKINKLAWIFLKGYELVKEPHFEQYKLE
jgi:poly(3-hydroxybutyrate) depolymerase